MSNIVILLIGLHGSGKSTFAKAVTGADVEISRTGGVIERKQFTIIDTPGLADKNTHEENLEILEQIAHQLGKIGQEHVNGVIYFHSIKNIRLGAVDRANIRILKAMCGEPFFPHVAFVTSHWDRIDHTNFGEQYETINHDLELERRKLLPKGPRIFRFLNDGKSHELVLDHFVNQANIATTVPPQLLFAEELKRYRYERRPSRAVRKTEASKQMAVESKKVGGRSSSCSIL
ncbi:P-loop containing nucleoside triphosphate hydrolase protein [Lasiosphaeris hirsuta]|uniref:P-loop containing nucleoside triphosphate hydrolase protein n=1 Tax=Lasiosphaeris hirsuta TaxID=260670 RepID=A0AA40A9L1_9PEZI|nr:P-loop containing nucleoside triphosphate hydrolase protein [Lasiosphaeris hirsuta]